MSGVAPGVVDLELQVGVLPPQHPHQRHEMVGGETGVEADPDLPVLARPGVARQQPRVLDRAERLPARHQECRAGVGQLDRPLVPVEEPDPEVFLQVHDLLADGGLRDEQPLGGTAVVELLCHRDERRQPPQLHTDSL